MSDGRKTVGKSLKRYALLILLLLIAAQFVPVDTRNPPVQAANSIYAVEKVPAQVRTVFDSSCIDCHSNQTRWPWYGHVAPMSWLVAQDVHQARNWMNLSEWGTYSEKKRDEKLENICAKLLNGDMPDGKYLLIHRSAQVSQEQKEAVCRWTQAPR